MDIKLLEKLLETQEAVAQLALAVAAVKKTSEADETAIEAQDAAEATALQLHRARMVQEAQGVQHA